MRTLTWITLLLFVLGGALMGCPAASDDDDDTSGDDDTAEVDTDGDGLTDAEEADLGTDPELADTDADGLTDFEEVEAGTDPLLVDSDGDTYSDFDEVNYGTDPLDPEDRIYIGYWPYNANKDQIEGLAFGQSVGVGDVIGHFIGPDPNEQDVDLYDFAGQGVNTIVDVSAGWCGYCQEWAKLLAGQTSYFDSWSDFDLLDDLVNDGSLQWVTILSENNFGGAPTSFNCQNWDGAWPNENVPVLADLEQVMPGHVDVYGYPTMVLVDENMEVIAYNRTDYTETIIEAIALASAM